MNTKINKFFNNIQYNFKDITELKPENRDFSLNITNFIKDAYAHDFNPRRYNFYIQFMEALNNPDVLKNVLYANTVIKSKKEVEDESIRKIVNGLQRLYMTPANTKGVDQVKYNEQKKLKRNQINTNISSRINKIVNEDSNSSDNVTSDSKKKVVNSIINSTFEVTGGAEDTPNDDATNNSIISLYSQKIFSDISQITNNLNKICLKYKKIKKYEDDNQIKSRNKLSEDANMIIDDKMKDLDGIQPFIKSSNGDNINISYDSPLISFINATDPIFKQRNNKLIEEPVVIPDKEASDTTSDTTSDTRRDNDWEKIAQRLIISRNSRKTTKGGDYILEDSEYQKLNDLVYDIENDTMRPITKLDISTEDRIIFIGITFIIRFIALSLIEWSMNTNFISSFKQAFMFYCVIYISIFCFITIIVNIIYNYPLQQLYSDKSLVDIQSMLYYFYIYTNGPMRLVIHLIFILILMLIPFIINMGNNIPDKANFNYETKKFTRNTLSRFTLVIWIITSLIAVRY